MLNWWQTLHPDAILLQIGPLKLHWYGVFMVLALVVAYSIFYSLAGRFSLDKKKIDEVAFYTCIAGIFGARFYEVFVVDPGYYLQNWTYALDVFSGGLAIHGAILFGALGLIVSVRKFKLPLLKVLDIAAPAVAIGQAIGRWGNFFNQEIYGLPTQLPWGISIEEGKRYVGYESYQLFHPIFLYESLLNLILFFVLYKFLLWEKSRYGMTTAIYIFGYGCIRFFLEYLRLDPTTSLFGFRTPQLVALLMMVFGLGGFIFLYFKNKNNKK